MPSLTTVAPVPMASIPVVGMSPPLVSSVPAAAVPPLANGAPAVIQPLPAFAHPGMLPTETLYSLAINKLFCYFLWIQRKIDAESATQSYFKEWFWIRTVLWFSPM